MDSKPTKDFWPLVSNFLLQSQTRAHTRKYQQTHRAFLADAPLTRPVCNEHQRTKVIRLG